MPVFFRELNIRQLLLLAKDFEIDVETPVEKNQLVLQLSAHKRAKTVRQKDIANIHEFEEKVTKRSLKRKEKADREELKKQRANQLEKEEREHAKRKASVLVLFEWNSDFWGLPGGVGEYFAPTDLMSNVFQKAHRLSHLPHGHFILQPISRPLSTATQMECPVDPSLSLEQHGLVAGSRVEFRIVRVL